MCIGVTPPLAVKSQLSRFLEERWKGVRPLAWGDSLRESEFTMWLYQGVCGMRQAAGQGSGNCARVMKQKDGGDAL